MPRSSTVSAIDVPRASVHAPLAVRPVQIGHDVLTPLCRLARCRLHFDIAVSAGGAFAQTTVTSERPASFTLDNGLQVVVIPDHRTPVVTQMIWYKVGSADETPANRASRISSNI